MTSISSECAKNNLEQLSKFKVGDKPLTNDKTNEISKYQSSILFWKYWTPSKFNPKVLDKTFKKVYAKRAKVLKIPLKCDLLIKAHLKKYTRNLEDILPDAFIGLLNLKQTFKKEKYQNIEKAISKIFKRYTERLSTSINKELIAKKKKLKRKRNNCHIKIDHRKAKKRPKKKTSSAKLPPIKEKNEDFKNIKKIVVDQFQTQLKLRRRNSVNGFERLTERYQQEQKKRMRERNEQKQSSLWNLKMINDSKNLQVQLAESNHEDVWTSDSKPKLERTVSLPVLKDVKVCYFDEDLAKQIKQSLAKQMKKRRKSLNMN